MTSSLGEIAIAESDRPDSKREIKDRPLDLGFQTHTAPSVAAETKIFGRVGK